MKVHLVSGFLGSGKTTAIISASKVLMEQGLKVGVITNDQGKFLVDTQFMRLNDIPAVEVNGGCFCCNYNDFNKSLEQIVEQVKPDVVFAESVGSCADIVATVVKPLMEFKTTHANDTTLSTFTDARLLHKYLLGEELPFQENVIYIFEQQIQEAGALIINKIDLLNDEATRQVNNLAQQKYADKKIILQSSLSMETVKPWLDSLRDPLGFTSDPLQISYRLYGAGEQNLAWYDAQLRIESGKIPAARWIQQFLNSVITSLQQEQIPVGHLKFLLSDGNHFQKISLVSSDSEGEISVDNFPDWLDVIEMTINARLECDQDRIQQIFRSILEQQPVKADIQFDILAEEAFHPGFPNPTHRLL
jgi:Ni2+-binding GTPase involved in maturation of urease and hydrogenase